MPQPTIKDCLNWPPILSSNGWRTAKGPLGLFVQTGISKQILALQAWRLETPWLEFNVAAQTFNQRRLEMFFDTHVWRGLRLLVGLESLAGEHESRLRKIPLQGDRAAGAARQVAGAARDIGQNFRRLAGNCYGNSWKWQDDRPFLVGATKDPQ